MWWRFGKGLSLKQETKQRKNAQERQEDVTVVVTLLMFYKFPNNSIAFETTVWQGAQADISY